MNKQQVMDFIIKHKQEIKTIGGLAIAFAGGIIAKSTIDNWRGYRLVKLRKGCDSRTVIGNIYTILHDSDAEYNELWDYNDRKLYLNINL